MSNQKLTVISKKGKIINTNPKSKSLQAPKHLKLSAATKKIFNSIIERIGDKMEIEEFHLEAMAMIAVEIETWVWVNEEIKKKNKEEPGTGYIQTFRSGATNITTEMAIRNQTLKNFANMSKKFGLTTRDLKELGDSKDPNQLELFRQILEA